MNILANKFSMLNIRHITCPTTVMMSQRRS
jgi:hypothetical protein